MKDIWTLLLGDLAAVVIAETEEEAKEIMRVLKPRGGWNNARAHRQGESIDTSEGLIFHGRRA